MPRIWPGGRSPLKGSGIPPFGNLDGYIFKKSNTTVTGVGHSSQANLLIQGNPIVLDGKTSILIEVFITSIETITGPANAAVGIELWDNFGGQVDKGTIAYTTGSVNGNVSDLLNGGVRGQAALTPAAGTHTYAIYAWKNTAGGTSTVFASAFVDGSGNLAPLSYRVITIPFDASLAA